MHIGTATRTYMQQKSKLKNPVENHLSKRHFCFQSETIKTFICEFFATCWISHAEICTNDAIGRNRGDGDDDRSPLRWRKGERKKKWNILSANVTYATDLYTNRCRRYRKCVDTGSPRCHIVLAMKLSHIYMNFQLNWKISTTSH